jgi:hypothetical protein
MFVHSLHFVVPPPLVRAKLRIVVVIEIYQKSTSPRDGDVDDRAEQ